MFNTCLIRFAVNQSNDNNEIAKELQTTLRREAPAPVFVIGSWQTGDFCHIYAAIVRHFSETPHLPCSILVLCAEGFSARFLLADIEFAIKPLCDSVGGHFTLYHTDVLSKNRLIEAMGRLMRTERNAKEPFDATFLASDLVKGMRAGQPLTPIWAAVTRKAESSHYRDYSGVCASFMEEYVQKFGLSSGRERFVCLWGRTSGMPTEARKLGGANPQYDSSEDGNQQLCLALKYNIPEIKAIFTVGDGFNDATRRLPHVFDLGEFWRRMQVVKGRFQENGFFDYMTAFFDCDVVHLGMKSGGMDSLGVWGQKVVFIDSVRSPAITASRVRAWETPSIVPVPIGAMPTSLGKAIESAREEDPKSFKTTFASAKKVTEMRDRAARAGHDNLFENDDLAAIVAAVRKMFGN